MKKKDQYVKSRAPRKKDQYVKSRAPQKKRINMSNQEHHEKKDQYVKSRAPRKKGSICQIKCAPTIAHMRHCQPHDCNVRSNKSIRKKGSICQFKSTTKKRINISNQKHHGRKDQYVNSRASRKKG